MDPVTNAVVAALPALASNVVKASVKDAYDGLKAVIQKKWGESAAITKGITELESSPASEHAAAVLAERVAAVKAAEDVGTMQAVALLVRELNDNVATAAVPGVAVNITGGKVEGGMVIAGKVSAKSISFGAPRDSHDSEG